MTPIASAFVCAMLAMPSAWGQYHPVPTVVRDDAYLWEYGVRTQGAFTSKWDKKYPSNIVMPESNMVYLPHEMAHSFGADEKEAQRVQKLCGVNK